MPHERRITIEVAGQPRTFLLHEPVVRSAHRALVIMLHGTGGTASWAADETGWSELADWEGFAVAYPDGLTANSAKPAKFLTNPPIWHDGSLGFDEETKQRADLAFISAIIDTAIDRADVDPRRVYVTGFSNGGGMTFSLAAAMAERLAAIAPVAGHCWLQAPQPSRPVPTLYIVGDVDPLIPLVGGNVRTPWGYDRVKPSVPDTLTKWARAIGCSEIPIMQSDDASKRLDVFPSQVENERFLAMTIHGLGHHWPGGKGKLSEKIGGPRVTTINACERIWQFFREHVMQRNGTKETEWHPY